MLVLAKRGNDLIKETLVEGVWSSQKLMNVLLGCVELVDAVDEHLNFANAVHHLVFRTHARFPLVIFSQLVVLEHIVAEVLHTEHVLQIKLDIVDS